MEPITSIERNDLSDAGILPERIEFAKSIGNHEGDPFLLRQAINRTARRYFETVGVSGADLDTMLPALAPPPAWIGMPTLGSVKVFALLIEFQDILHSNEADTIHDSLFGSPATGQPYESLSDYYRRASYNQLNIGGATLGWYKTNKNRSDIVQNTVGRETLIKEAIQHFNALGHDFSQYDNNNDGVVDYFMVFWTGPDSGWATFWWGYQTNFSDQTFIVDGVRFGRYSWQWEARPVGGIFTPRVVIHETGHGLGLPDLYDYDGNIGPDGGVGGIDMMDANQCDLNCFSKWMLDWLSPTVLVSGCQNITLDPSGTSKDCVAIWPALSHMQMFSEFFMVQNRQHVGNDLTIPATGLMIWHIDASLNMSGQNFNFNNSYTSHKFTRLMEADGLEEIEANRGFNAGDLYTPGDTFGPTSVPSNAAYDGTVSEIQVTNISVSGNRISADICASLKVPNIKVPSYVNFGTIKRGTSRTKTIKIENTGTGKLSCNISLNSQGAPFSTGPGTCGNFTPLIEPGASCSINVTFKANKLEPQHAMITITSNDPDTPVARIGLIGAGKNGIIP